MTDVLSDSPGTAEFPTNIDGKPEFGSVIVTFDPKLSRDKIIGGHIVQKMVYSTQLPEVALERVIHYYGESEIMELPSTVEIFKKGFLADAIYVYVTKTGVIEALLGTGAFRTIIEVCGEGSSLLGVSAVHDMVSQVIAQGKEASGDGSIPPLSMVEIEPVAADAAVREGL